MRIFFSFLFLSFLFFFSCETNPYPQGQILYETFCANCHMEDGTGLTGVIPPLKNVDFLTTHKRELPCIIRFGLTGKIQVNGRYYEQEMTGIPELTEFEIANILNYVNFSWNSPFEYTKVADVKTALEECVEKK